MCQWASERRNAWPSLILQYLISTVAILWCLLQSVWKTSPTWLTVIEAFAKKSRSPLDCPQGGSGSLRHLSHLSLSPPGMYLPPPLTPTQPGLPVICCLVAQLCQTLCNTMDCSPPGSSVCGFPGKNPGVGCHFLLYGSSDPGFELTSLALAGGFLTTEPPGKPCH